MELNFIDYYYEIDLEEAVAVACETQKVVRFPSDKSNAELRSLMSIINMQDCEAYKSTKDDYIVEIYTKEIDDHIMG